MANFNLNKVILGGRLTAEPELRTTQSGISVVRFTVAVNRRRSKEDQQQQTDFINAVAWRQQAEFLSRYFHKGSSICVIGSIHTGSSTDQNGQKRYYTEVVADEVSFVDSKQGQSESQSMPDASTGGFADMRDDDDFPF